MAKTVQLMGVTLVLLPERALFVPDMGLLVVADWHLGKTAHFRKAGIFLPVAPVERDVARLQDLLARLPVRTLIFLGDLFHSDLNSEWRFFADFRRTYPGIPMVLTRGNHDLLSEELFARLDVAVVDRYEARPDLVFMHHPDAVPVGKASDNRLVVAGHVHPGCLIPANGRQAYRLPCFYFHRNTLLLPAFGRLTGMQLVQPTRSARIYPVAGDEVLEWSSGSTPASRLR